MLTHINGETVHNRHAKRLTPSCPPRLLAPARLPLPAVMQEAEKAKPWGVAVSVRDEEDREEMLA